MPPRYPSNERYPRFSRCVGISVPPQYIYIDYDHPVIHSLRACIPLIVPYRGRPMYGPERAHRLCLNYIVPNSLVAHIPRADDVVSSKHFFPLANKRTRIDTPFKDRVFSPCPPRYRSAVRASHHVRNSMSTPELATRRAHGPLLVLYFSCI